MGFSRGAGRSHFCLSLHLVTNGSVSMNVFHTIQNPYVFSSSKLSLGKETIALETGGAAACQGQAEWQVWWQGPG